MQLAGEWGVPCQSVEDVRRFVKRTIQSLTPKVAICSAPRTKTRSKTRTRTRSKIKQEQEKQHTKHIYLGEVHAQLDEGHGGEGAFGRHL